MTRRCGIGLFLALLLGGIIPRAGAEQTNGVSAINLAIWCEFLPYRQVEETMPALARYDCDLIIHVETNTIGDAAFARLCRKARTQNVDVVAWFLLPYEEHLYVGEDSLAVTRELTSRFLDWAQKKDLGIETVVFDCEPSPLLGRRLFKEVRSANLFGLARVLKTETAPQRFARSVTELNDTIAGLHQRGVRVMGAGNRVFLDFLDQGNPTVEDSLNAPFTMIHWDRISFITYRYTASQVEYVAMIRRYATLARRYFQDRAALDLGLLGDHRGIPENARRAELFGGGDFFMDYLKGMRSVYELEEAVGAALGCGVSNINLYSLDGAVESVAGLDLWLKAARSSRPRSGLEAWTPVASLRLGLTASLLDSLYKWWVGKPPPPAHNVRIEKGK